MYCDDHVWRLPPHGTPCAEPAHVGNRQPKGGDPHLVWGVAIRLGRGFLPVVPAPKKKKKIKACPNSVERLATPSAGQSVPDRPRFGPRLCVARNTRFCDPHAEDPGAGPRGTSAEVGEQCFSGGAAQRRPGAHGPYGPLGTVWQERVGPA